MTAITDDTTDCASDPLKLVREGTSQEQRRASALDPASAPVNEHTLAHSAVFAQAYAQYLQFYDANNAAIGNWQPFFSQDVAVQFALAAIQDIEHYKFATKSYFTYLNNLENKTKEAELKTKLGYLFSCLGTLAQQLDQLKDTLPTEIALKGILQNLIRSQLAPAFQRLLAIYKADLALAATPPPTPPNPHLLIAKRHPALIILGAATINFADLYAHGLSSDWITDNTTDWATYRAAISPNTSVYGSANSVFQRINHLATHNLFTLIFDQFLKVYARVVSAARQSLEETLTQWDRHEPHYALFLAFLRLLEYARAEANTLTARHLDFYYREILRLKEKSALPGKAHLLVELAKHATQHELNTGQLFKAGKDGQGKDAFFANDRTFVANQAKVESLKTLYRHKNKPKDTLPFQDGRLFAAPSANSEDGLGAALTSPDQSWHPFYHKIYRDGALQEIKMPSAEIGIAVASHYLWMAEGQREVTVNFIVTGYEGEIGADWTERITCALSGEKGWIEKAPTRFTATTQTNFTLTLSLAGDEAAVTAYNQKVHGFAFATTTPVLLIQLRHKENADYLFPLLENVELQQIKLQVIVSEVRSLVLSNDIGPVDVSKPFFPFGPQPEAGSALILGSQEIFAKKNVAPCSLLVRWKNKPGSLSSIAYYPKEESDTSAAVVAQKDAVPQVNVAWLKAGTWQQDLNATSKELFASDNEITINIQPPTDGFNKQDQADFQLAIPYSVSAKTGYVRLALTAGMGHKDYRDALIKYLIDVANKVTPVTKPTEPYTPEVESLSVSYVATQTIEFTSSDRKEFEQRSARTYHLTPFGAAEQHPYLKIIPLDPNLTRNTLDQKIYLLPQLKHLAATDVNLSAVQPVSHEAEFYLGITGLKPPQNLALLFQVADGTANPLAEKPKPHSQHIHWSYLRNNEWVSFADSEVEDHADGLLNSGIITFAVPRDASADNTLMPTGMHWLRAAVEKQSDAVCLLRMVAAQALEATFANQENDPAFSSSVLPAGTISKLHQPAAAVKKITQPFATFGGRGAEQSAAFYTRVSERLRHKDRALALWDYERLILEAFPQIYKVKCLNHTQYGPDKSGTVIYHELVAGHVTIVTIPQQQAYNLRDPLRPYTSLALLSEIGAFLRTRLSCFVKLHVRNPVFEEVRTEFSVQLYEGFDKTFYRKKLQEELTRFLSPWAFPGGGSPSFGGKIHQSVLLNFIEERPYVDYVTDFKLFHYKEDQPREEAVPECTEVEGTKAVSILVSVPAEFHNITVLAAVAATLPHEKCLCDV